MYYFVDPRALSSSLDYLISSTYTLEHLIIYCECIWWQAKTLFSLSLFFLGVSMAQHLFSLNKLASCVLSWLFALSENVDNYRVVRKTSLSLFLSLFIALSLINRVGCWCTGKLVHSSMDDLRHLYRSIPLVNHRPWGTHFVFLYRFRLWLYRCQHLHA